MELDFNERLLWKGIPKQGIVFTSWDILLIPFSIIWGGFAVFCEFSVIETSAPSFFKLWGIPFLVIGLYFILGRFIHDFINRMNTEYIVTNKRVVFRKYNTIESIPIGKWSSLKLIEYANGSGSILFAEPLGAFSRYRSMSYMLSSNLGVPAFYRIQDAKKVMEILNGLV